jgi:hypothetical protein
LLIDGDVVMRGEDLGETRSGSEKLGETGRGSEGGGEGTEKAAYGFRQLFVIITCVI